MRFLLIGIIFLLHSTAFSQTETWNQKNSDGLKIGNWRDFHENGKLRYVGQFKEGKPVGTFRNYYPDGKIQAIREFIGPEYSRVRFYYQNGDVMAKGYYSKQLKDSLWQTFGADSTLVTEGNYIKDKKFGKWKVYFPNGRIAEEINYVDDLEDGPYKKYFDNGTLRQEANYVKGVLDGISIFYDPNGVKTMKGKYYRGVRHGKWVHYDDQGVLKKVVEYDMGENLTEDEEDEYLDLDSEKYRDNRKDQLEFEDLRGKIKYNQ